jgi:hypothetical protein
VRMEQETVQQRVVVVVVDDGVVDGGVVLDDHHCHQEYCGCCGGCYHWDVHQLVVMWNWVVGASKRGVPGIPYTDATVWYKHNTHRCGRRAIQRDNVPYCQILQSILHNAVPHHWVNTSS